jgi:hypothetical protein
MDLKTLGLVMRSKDMAAPMWALALSFLVLAYTPFVLMNLWDWFVTDAIHANAISYWQALGFILIIYVVRLWLAGEAEENWQRAFLFLERSVPDLRRDSVMDAAKEKDRKRGVGTELGKLAGHTFLLVIGWGIHAFLMYVRRSSKERE